MRRWNSCFGVVLTGGGGGGGGVRAELGHGRARRPKRGWFVGLARSFKIDRFVISFLTQRQVPRSFNNLHKEKNQETLGYCSGRSRLFKATICYIFNTES